MSLVYYLFFALVGLLLLLFAWSMRKPGRRARTVVEAGALGEGGRGHVTHLPQIRQAFAPTDSAYLSKTAPRALVRRVRQERRSIALAYLSAVREDFQSLLRMANTIAMLSPELAALEEFERLRLTVKFVWRYEVIRMQLRAGIAPIPRLDGLSNFVSSISVRMEAAMKELGERAALAAELASSFDGRGSNSA